MINLTIKLHQLFQKKIRCKKKNIIITGGYGTIGLALSRRLIKQGYNVIIIDTKISKINKFKKP